MRSASDSDEDVVELHPTETARTSASNATDPLTELDKVAGDLLGSLLDCEGEEPGDDPVVAEKGLEMAECTSVVAGVPVLSVW